MTEEEWARSIIEDIPGTVKADLADYPPGFRIGLSKARIVRHPQTYLPQVHFETRIIPAGASADDLGPDWVILGPLD